MSLQKRVYSVLLVSAAPQVGSALRGLLSPGVFSPVRSAADVGAARRALAARAFDIVIVDSPLPDASGVRLAIDASGTGGTVALLLVPAEDFNGITDVVAPHGVFTLGKPMSRQTAQTALGWLISARERMRKTEQRTLTLEEKMEEIRLVNRAKWLLIERRGMDEPAAHRFIEKQAMDRCVSRRTVAEELLAEERHEPQME